MNSRLLRLLALSALACVGLPTIASGLNIRIRYDNHGGLFPPDSEARTALRAVCDFYEEIITDRLGTINPDHFGGASWEARYSDPSTGQLRVFRAPNGSANIIIPENDFFLFAGSRSLPGNVAGEGGGTEFVAHGNSSEWFEQVINRGQPGAGTTGSLADLLSRTDFAPWGGIVSFDKDRAWDFSLDRRGQNGGTSFVSVALHEVAHALGFGVADSFLNLIEGNNFTGPATRIAYTNRTGPRSVPLSASNHFRDDAATTCTEPGGFGSNGVFNTLSKTLKLFGTPSDRFQQVLMDSSTCNSTNYHQVMTRVDIAALQDIGWNVIERIDPESLNLSIEKPTDPISAPPVLTFGTQPSYVYQLQRSENLLVWEDVGSPVIGNGSTQSLSDTVPLPAGCSYRITISAPTPPSAAPTKSPAKLLLPTWDKPRTITSGPARICRDCEFHTHDHHHEDGDSN